jgi:hypothetical protein
MCRSDVINSFRCMRKDYKIASIELSWHIVVGNTPNTRLPGHLEAKNCIDTRDLGDSQTMYLNNLLTHFCRCSEPVLFYIRLYLCDKKITRWRTRVGRLVDIHTKAVYVPMTGNGRCWYIFIDIWSILRQVGIFYCHMVYLLVIWYTFTFWYVVPKDLATLLVVGCFYDSPFSASVFASNVSFHDVNI